MGICAGRGRGGGPYLYLSMQHVVPELGLAEVIVATGKLMSELPSALSMYIVFPRTLDLSELMLTSLSESNAFVFPGAVIFHSVHSNGIRNCPYGICLKNFRNFNIIIRDNKLGIWICRVFGIILSTLRSF